MPVSKIVLTSIENASTETQALIESTSDPIAFFHGLNTRTRRDLVKYPPIDNEPLSNMGVPIKTGADRIRIWINNEFRTPHGERRLTSGEVKLSTKYSKLKTLAGV